MKLARELGISHRRLLGWEPETTYTRDPTGLVVASRPEPEWSDAERAKMLALAQWEATEICPRCGGPKSICQDPAARYTTSPPVRCHYTDAAAREHEAWTTDKRPRPQALIPQIRPVI